MHLYLVPLQFLFAGAVLCIQKHTSYSCDSPIYCEGPILKTVQLAKLFSDSKTFVDMPTKKPEADVIRAFYDMGGENATQSQIRQFVDENFLEAGAEVRLLKNITTLDLDWLNQIEDPLYQGWANTLNRAWANLTFVFDDSVLCDGCVTSSIPVKRPFVVPGGRFREFYYWDSYFVIRGLLLSEQIELARNMLENFFDFIEVHGFIPNGARIYYLNRSQPPFLTHMVEAFYEKTGDHDFLTRALPILEKEYDFWMTNNSIRIQDPKHPNRTYLLNRYVTDNASPRPESYLEDYNTVHGANVSSPEALYADIAAGAESGYDYSSRWVRHKVPAPDQVASYELLRTIETSNVLPVDLNALMYYTETRLAHWIPKRSGYYRKKAADRRKAIECLMWNDHDLSFYDYNITGRHQNLAFTPANLYPLWVGALPERLEKNRTALAKVFDETEQALLKYPGILTTSYLNTTLQWDWPNGWPPLSYIAMQGMLNVDQKLNHQKGYRGPVLNTSRGTSLTKLARVLAERYIASAYCGWYNTGGSLPGLLSKGNATDDGHMFEKFDVNTIGLSGSQGEYVSQTGFGWTNAVALWIFSKWTDFAAPDCNNIVQIAF